MRSYAAAQKILWLMLLTSPAFATKAWASQKFKEAPSRDSSAPGYLELGPWSELICRQLQSNSRKFPLDELQLAGLYLANISLVNFEIPGKQPEWEILHERARAEMLSKKHLGYSTGKCNGKTTGRPQYWILTAASPILLNPSILSDVNHGPLMSSSEKHCRQLQIQGIGAQDNAATLFALSDFPLQGPAAKKEWEIFGIYCFPKDVNYGPVLWGLLPPQKADSSSRSALTTLPTVDGDLSLTRESLHAWMNKARAERKLKQLALMTDRQIVEHIRSGLHGEGVKHLRPLLQSQRTALLRAGYHFLGENRVQADTLREASRLLWQSPAHRSLLLIEQADHVVILSDAEEAQPGTAPVWVIVSLQKRVWDQSWRKTPPDFSQKSKTSDPTKKLE